MISRMSLKRFIPKGVNLLHKSVMRFKSTTAESSISRNEELNLKAAWKNIVRIFPRQFTQVVANFVVIGTGCAVTLLIGWEFFSIGHLKIEFAEMRQDIVSQAVRADKLFEKWVNQTADSHKQFDKIFDKLMDQTTENQKQFATLTEQFSVLAKENADASKKADERYYELLNALKK